MGFDFFDRNSFKFEIAITLKSGETLRFAANNTFGSDSYFNGKARVNVSPKELGNCADTVDLIRLIRKGVYDGDRPLFTRGRRFRDAFGILRDPNIFLERINDKVWYMNDIDFIEVIGEARYDTGREIPMFDYQYLQYYRYDMCSRRFEGIVYGEPRDTDHTAGELNICTKGCKIRRVSRPEDFLNVVEDLPNDDVVRSGYGTSVRKNNYLTELFGSPEDCEYACDENYGRWHSIFGEDEEEYDNGEELPEIGISERIKRLEEEHMNRLNNAMWELVDSGITIEDYVSIAGCIYEEEGIEINELFADCEEDEEDGAEINELFAEREEDNGDGMDLNELFEELADQYEWDGTYSYGLPDDEDGIEINELFSDCEDDDEDGISVNALFEALDIPTYEPIFKFGVPVI